MGNRDKVDQKPMLARLRRLEGQTRGIITMVEAERSCEEIITQLSAVSAGVTAAAREVLLGHIEHSVVDGARSGNTDDVVADLRKAVMTFSKLK